MKFTSTNQPRSGYETPESTYNIYSQPIIVNSTPVHRMAAPLQLRTDHLTENHYYSTAILRSTSPQPPELPKRNTNSKFFRTANG